jgi:hypothetical protein
MHRRKTKLELAALLLLTVASSAVPAHANGFATNTKTLPDASKIYTAPIQADIVDTSPIVRDTRKPVDNTTIMINVGPPPVGQNRVIQVGGDGTMNGGNPSGPGTIPIRQNNLPSAAMRSNIPAISPVSGVLPPGQVGHRLDARGVIRPQLAKQGSKATPTGAGNKSPNGGRVPVLTYPTTPTSGTGISAEKSSTTRVKGDLLNH